MARPVAPTARLAAALLLRISPSAARGVADELVGDVAAELASEMLAVTYAPDADRAGRWLALLERMFEPQRVDPLAAGVAPAEAELADGGAALCVAAAAGATALRLAAPADGPPFAPRQLRLAGTLVRLMRAADEHRRAYAQALERDRRDERARAARDPHDEARAAVRGVDPRALLEHAGGDGAMRDAMRRIRAIVSGAEGEPARLGEVLADARFDAVLRLGGRGVAVNWPPPEPDPDDPVLGGAARLALAAFFHEAVTNVLKHAGATRVTVRAGVGAGAARGVLTCEVTDDGAGFDPGVGRAGQGLPAMHARAGTLGGTLVLTSRRGEGTTLRLVAPVAAVAVAPVPLAPLPS